MSLLSLKKTTKRRVYFASFAKAGVCIDTVQKQQYSTYMYQRLLSFGHTVQMPVLV